MSQRRPPTRVPAATNAASLPTFCPAVDERLSERGAVLIDEVMYARELDDLPTTSLEHAAAFLRSLPRNDGDGLLLHNRDPEAFATVCRLVALGLIRIGALKDGRLNVQHVSVRRLKERMQ